MQLWPLRFNLPCFTTDNTDEHGLKYNYKTWRRAENMEKKKYKGLWAVLKHFAP